MHSVAAFVNAQVLATDDSITTHDGIFRSLQVDPYQIMLQPVADDPGAIAFGGDKNTAVFSRQLIARVAYRNALYQHILRCHSDCTTGSAAVDNAVVIANDIDAAINDNRAWINPTGQPEGSAGLGAGNRSGQRVVAGSDAYVCSAAITGSANKTSPAANVSAGSGVFNRIDN